VGRARRNGVGWRRGAIAIAWLLAACRIEGEPVAPQPPEPASTHDDEDDGEPHVQSQGERPTARPRPSKPPEPSTPMPAYDRGAWTHWIDADGDCQDTRTEVLVAQSRTPVTFTDERGCDVARGQWVCPYTGKRVTDPAVLDIDHLVPLARVHEAGGGRWDEARRAAYANDLGDPRALVAVDRSANRSRGARGVHEWLPPEASHRCEFLEAYASVVRRWDLELDAEEEEALFQFLETCDAGNVPDLQQLDLPKTDVRALTDPEPEAPTGRCCKHCKAGKPCGDTCIPKNRTCHAAPGCAC
jgi:hypothetical protein